MTNAATSKANDFKAAMQALCAEYGMAIASEDRNGCLEVVSLSEDALQAICDAVVLLDDTEC